MSFSVKWETHNSSSGAVLTLSGSVEREQAPIFGEELRRLLSEADNPTPELACGGLEYLSVSALRELVGLRGRFDFVLLSGLNDRIYEQLRNTGLDRFLRLEKSLRRISAEGLPLIGKGQTAAVYRLNEEQVLKLYKQGFPLSMVRQERDMTAAAQEAGFSAPIPFELVTSGKQYGAVYEYVPGLTLKQHVLEDPSRLSYYAAIYADFIKSSHKNTSVRSGVPSLKQRWKDLSSAITLSDASERASLLDALNRIPDCSCLLHADANPSNLLITGNASLTMLDFFTAGTGHPVFDLQGVYYPCLLLFPPYCTDPREQQLIPALWNAFLQIYFAGLEPASIAGIARAIRIVAGVRFLFYTQFFAAGSRMLAARAEEVRRSMARDLAQGMILWSE